MLSNPTYHRRKALKICVNCGDRPSEPLVSLCTHCREIARERKATWTAANPARAQATIARWKERHGRRGGPSLLACCGRWHTINAIPFTTPCCCTTYFAEEPD